MSKILLIFGMLIFGLFYSQKSTEKALEEIDRISMENPDSALTLFSEMEPKLEQSDLKSKLLLSKGNAFSLKHLSSESLNSGFQAYDIADKAKDSIMMINSLCFIGNQY